MRIHPGWLLVFVLAQSHAEPPASKAASKPRPTVTVRLFGNIESLHAEYVHRFETVPGFGFERTIRPGFRDQAPVLSWSGSTFHAEPPQLIGLEDGPKAYLSLGGSEITLRQMTNQTIRSRMATRPLTAFESNALPRLVAGTPHVVSTSEPNAANDGPDSTPTLRILARLDAGPTCAKCHGCPEGTMLGAFSYTLRPTSQSSPSNSIMVAARSR